MKHIILEESNMSKEFINEFKKFGLKYELLGMVTSFPIWIFHSERASQNPNMLITAGIHGEEISGPLGVKHWVERIGNFKNINVSLIPLMNPGRFGMKGEESVNSYFFRKIPKSLKERGEGSSDIRKLLIKNTDKLVRLANDGLLTLHEDLSQDTGHLYVYEDSKTPTDFAIRMRDEMKKHFKIMDDEPLKKLMDDFGEPYTYLKDGIVLNLKDGTFEDYLNNKGVKRVVVWEGAGKEVSLNKRIKANVSAISTFLK
jgi:hypothetical protein